MAASSEKTDREREAEGEDLRPSGARRRSSGPLIDRSGDRPVDAFDDVTPTRSLAEVGLADMDEDLPTRMQTLDEVGRFRSASAQGVAPELVEAPPPAPHRDVVPPPPVVEPAAEAAAAAPIAFRSFPPPKGRDTVPTVPPAPPVPRIAGPALAPSELALREPIPSEPDARGRRILLAISFALLVLAAGALALDRLAP